MTGTENWIPNEMSTAWRHRHRKQLVVKIERAHRKYGLKYQVVHYHPGMYGSVIRQDEEFVDDMATARRKAGVHLRHWNDSRTWVKDPDYGRKT